MTHRQNNPEIKRQEQLIARYEKSLALEKLKKRRADTRRKIELGGLVIKSRLSQYDKCLILGVMKHAVSLLDDNPEYYRSIFKNIGEATLKSENCGI